MTNSEILHDEVNTDMLKREKKTSVEKRNRREKNILQRNIERLRWKRTNKTNYAIFQRHESKEKYISYSNTNMQSPVETFTKKNPSILNIHVNLFPRQRRICPNTYYWVEKYQHSAPRYVLHTMEETDTSKRGKLQNIMNKENTVL